MFTKDGRVLTYGQFGHSTVVVRKTGINRIWALDTVRDRSGNSVNIVYRSHTGSYEETAELVPEYMYYGGQPPSRSVSFSYERRPDFRTHYTAGAEGASTERLVRINTYVQARHVKQYRIEYENRSGSDWETRLTSVTECGRGPADPDQVCKPPTTFEYNEAGTFGEAQAIQEINLPVWSTGGGCTCPPNENCSCSGAYYIGRSLIVLDADGDGRDDVFGYTYKSTSPADSKSILAISRYPNGFEFTVPWATGTVAPSAECVNAGSVMDINRDGKDDLVNLCPDGQGNVIAYISNGSGFEPQPVGQMRMQFHAEPVRGPTWELSTAGRGKLADLDGDGLRDLVVCSDNTISSAGQNLPQHTLNFALNNGLGFFAEPQPYSPVGYEGEGPCEDLLVMDFDGDGADELVEVRGSDERIMVTKLLQSPGGGYSIVPQHVGYRMTFAGNEWNYKAADLNGDGLKDLLFAPPASYAGLGGVVEFNTGRGFDGRHTMLAASVLDSFKRGVVMDYDGDGREGNRHGRGHHPPFGRIVVGVSGNRGFQVRTARRHQR